MWKKTDHDMLYTDQLNIAVSHCNKKEMLISVSYESTWKITIK